MEKMKENCIRLRKERDMLSEEVSRVSELYQRAETTKQKFKKALQDIQQEVVASHKIVVALK